MATPPFKYQPMFEKGKDTTEYYLLTKDYVSVSEFEGNPILKIEKEGLTAMANAAFRDVSFMLRRSHNEQVAKILSDPEASENDKYVALTFLRNAEVASKGILPFCQDTGTAIIHGEKGQQVWTGYSDEEALSLGVYKTYTEENLRYSQNAPLNMYDEVNTKCNLPAQIDIEATEGMEYEFLCVTKGGGSANKTYLYQETKAILNPGTLVPFLVEKMKTLGTAACPPYHIAFVIGGTSAEKNLLTVKLASTHFYDNLPTTGNEYGRAFRDVGCFFLRKLCSGLQRWAVTLCICSTRSRQGCWRARRFFGLLRRRAKNAFGRFCFIGFLSACVRRWRFCACRLPELAVFASGAGKNRFFPKKACGIILDCLQRW